MVRFEDDTRENIIRYARSCEKGLLDERQKLRKIKTWFEENVPEWIHRQDWFEHRAVEIPSGKLLELEKILRPSCQRANGGEEH